MLPPDGLRQSCDATSLGGYSSEIIRAVQAREAVHGAAGDPERTLREFVTQPTGIGRQVAVWPEFQPPVSSTGELIEKAFPRRLPPIVGEPHPPRVRAASEAKPSQLAAVGHS